MQKIGALDPAVIASFALGSCLYTLGSLWFFKWLQYKSQGSHRFVNDRPWLMYIAASSILSVLLLRFWWVAAWHRGWQMTLTVWPHCIYFSYHVYEGDGCFGRYEAGPALRHCVTQCWYHMDFVWRGLHAFLLVVQLLGYLSEPALESRGALWCFIAGNLVLVYLIQAGLFGRTYFNQCRHCKRLEPQRRWTNGWMYGTSRSAFLVDRELCLDCNGNLGSLGALYLKVWLEAPAWLARLRCDWLTGPGSQADDEDREFLMLLLRIGQLPKPLQWKILRYAR